MLLRAEKEQTSVYLVLRDMQQEYAGADARIRARMEALSVGTVRHLLSIDYVLNLFASVKTKDMKPFIRGLLRMSVYRILFSREGADAKVTDYAVRLCTDKGYGSLKGFVNGVLRRVVREKDNIDYPSISLRYSVPDWIVRVLTAQAGEEEAERICACAAKVPPLTVRPDPRMSEADISAFPERIAEGLPEGSLLEHPLFPGFAYMLEGRVYPPVLNGFREGQLFVQDAGAMLAAFCCGVRCGDVVVDVCASPGGKALLIAQLMEKMERDAGTASSGIVHAFDVSREKCARIEENAKRMHTENLRTAVRDARYPDETLKGKADIVLCDVPCSGLGVMARKADIRYRVQPEDPAQLQTLQREIVAASVSYLKKGGVLLYSTCTLTREENEDNARYIREKLPLTPDALTPYLPGALLNTPEAETAGQGFLTLLPGRHETDGFFIARFVKTGDDV